MPVHHLERRREVGCFSPVLRDLMYCLNSVSFCSVVIYYIYTSIRRGFEFDARFPIVLTVDVTFNAVINGYFTELCVFSGTIEFRIFTELLYWSIFPPLSTPNISNRQHESQR